MISYEFLIEDTFLISTNEMYFARPCKGGRSAYILKTNNLRKFEDEIDLKLSKLISEEFINKLSSELVNDKIAIKLSIDIGMNETDFFRVDSSNYLKALEDAIKYRLNIDDTRNVTVVSTKHIINSNDGWNTDVLIETYELPFDVPEGKWSSKIRGDNND